MCVQEHRINDRPAPHQHLLVSARAGGANNMQTAARQFVPYDEEKRITARAVRRNPSNSTCCCSSNLCDMMALRTTTAQKFCATKYKLDAEKVYQRWNDKDQMFYKLLHSFRPTEKNKYKKLLHKDRR